MYVYLSLPGHQPEKYHIKICSFFLSNYVISMCIWWTTHGGPFWSKNSKNPQKLGFTTPAEFCRSLHMKPMKTTSEFDEGLRFQTLHCILISYLYLSIYPFIYRYISFNIYTYLSIYPYLGTRTVSILQFSCGSRWQSSLGIFCTKSRDSVLQTWNINPNICILSFDDKSHCPNGFKCMCFEELSNFEEHIFYVQLYISFEIVFLDMDHSLKMSLSIFSTVCVLLSVCLSAILIYSLTEA